MPSQLLGLIVVVAVGACKPPTVEDGGRCARDYDCNDGRICFEQTCGPRRTMGQTCTPGQHTQCLPLVCGARGVCMTPDELAAERAARDEAERRAMLQQSGLAKDGVEHAMGAVEHEVRPRGPGLAVRVSQTRTEGSGFAACRDDERLIGGSCDAIAVGTRRGEVRRSAPGQFGAEDTVGGRWLCESSIPDHPIVSYALCQQLEPPAAAGSPRTR